MNTWQKLNKNELIPQTVTDYSMLNLYIWCMTIVGNADIDIVKALLSAGASTEACDQDDLTPLLQTIFTGRNDITKFLIDNGANINRLVSHDYSALHHAAWNGNIEVVQMLLDNGARDDDPTDDGNTPLALAAHGGCYDVLDFLIRRGCCVNISDKSVLVKRFVLFRCY